MPYYRKGGYRRKYPYKRRYKGRRRGKYSLYRRIKNLEIKQYQERPSFEYEDTAGTANIYTTAQVIKIAGGATNTRVLLKSFQAKFRIFFQTPQTTRQYFRVVLFTDRSNEGGAVPTWGDVYKNATGADAVMSLRHIATGENEGQRFKVLMDKRVYIIEDSDGTSEDVKYFSKFKKINIPSINSNSGGYWEKGGLYLGFVGTTATDVTDMLYDIRVRWIQKSRT